MFFYHAEFPKNDTQFEKLIMITIIIIIKKESDRNVRFVAFCLNKKGIYWKLFCEQWLFRKHCFIVLSSQQHHVLTKLEINFEN